MIRLLYCSQATSGVSDDQVENILVAARRNNKALGITGVLVQGGGMFMQLLEGPELAVLRLYVKISDDPRHGDCRLIYISPANERLFECWSMGVVNSDPLKLKHVAELRARPIESVNAKVFTDAMRSFAKMLVEQ